MDIQAKNLLETYAGYTMSNELLIQ